MNNNISSKQKLIILTIILVVLIVGVNILKALGKQEGIWNYKEITSATDVISSGSIITDRKTYYELEDIIVRFLLANDGISTTNLETENIGYDATYKDYYSILTKEYKKHLSRKEFNEKANKLLNRFVIPLDIEEFGYMNTKNIIKNIYGYGDNKYLCELQSYDNVGYIGIQLNPYKDCYYIFYIE